MNKDETMAALAAVRAKLRPFLPGAALVAAGFAAGWLVGIAGGEHAPPALPVHGPPEPMANQAMAAPYIPLEPEGLAAAMAPLPGTPAYRHRAREIAPQPTISLPQEQAANLGQVFEPEGTPAPQAGPPAPQVAVLIDDMGLLEDATRKAIALDPAVSMAFLPYARNSAALAREALAAGHRVLLHMPMEPAGIADPGPDALLVGMAPAEIRLRLAKAFDSVPGAIGLNNHMGSRFTSDAAAMASVIDVVASRGLMILDSMTARRAQRRPRRLSRQRPRPRRHSPPVRRSRAHRPQHRPGRRHRPPLRRDHRGHRPLAARGARQRHRARADRLRRQTGADHYGAGAVGGWGTVQLRNNSTPGAGS